MRPRPLGCAVHKLPHDIQLRNDILKDGDGADNCALGLDQLKVCRTSQTAKWCYRSC